MEESASIHLYPGSYKRKGFLLHIATSAASRGATYIWVNTGKRSDITKLEKLSSVKGIRPVAFLKNPSLAIEAMESGAYALALPYHLAGHLCDLYLSKSPDGVIKESVEIYLTNFPAEISGSHSDLNPCPHSSSYYGQHSPAETPGGKDHCNPVQGQWKNKDRITHSVISKENLVNLEFTRVLNQLKSHGFEHITPCIFHENIVASFNLSRFLNKEYGTKTLACIRINPLREELLYEIALLGGSLLCEGISRGILILPPAPQDKQRPLTNVKRHFENGIELSKKVLGTTGYIKLPYTIISCPVCGRCQLDIPSMASRVERIMRSIEKKYRRKGSYLEEVGGIRVAVMGCNVNGPGEARDADIGIAGGKGKTGTIFMNGKPLITVSEKRLLGEFKHHIENFINKRFEIDSVKL